MDEEIRIKKHQKPSRKIDAYQNNSHLIKKRTHCRSNTFLPSDLQEQNNDEDENANEVHILYAESLYQNDVAFLVFEQN